MNALPVLIVEDDQDLLEAICATMRLSDYQAIAASNGIIHKELLSCTLTGA